MEIRTLNTSRYRLEIELADQVGKAVLTDTYSGVAFADSEYRYSAYVECEGEIFYLEGLYNPIVQEEQPDRGGRIISITGRLGSSECKPLITIRHRLFIPEDKEFLEEQIDLTNHGSEDIRIRGYRFGFRKLLEKPRAYGGHGSDIENYRLIAIPFRLQPDGKKHDYQLDDVYHGRYQCSEFRNDLSVREEIMDRGRARSEGWAWSDGENGLLIIKYNPENIEFSMLETEQINGNVYLNFGGASPSLCNEPLKDGVLKPGQNMAFGLSHYLFYEGRWRMGAYLFRDYMSGLGHGTPDNYDPPVMWNELYNIGWHHSNHEALARHYTLDTIREEAEKARDMGCEAIYLDPGWEVCEGGTTWDEERLGDIKEFVRVMKSDYGLKVGLRTIGRSYFDDYPGMYRLSHNGTIGYHMPYSFKPFYEPCICNKDYRVEKLKRILRLAEAGINFIMFDEFDWRGPCFNPSHGHPVPSTPGMHAEAVSDIIRAVHHEYPNILIEAHDSVWPWGVRYLPTYFTHDKPGSFDESWGFEFMWNPLEDLISGRALSLFYYALAYDLPLYLHINMDNDNDNCLAFWWYASTVRHLGIGGGKANDKRYQAYKRAMSEYISMKDLYASGQFYAVDELTHIHVLPEAGRCVLNAFNLTDTPISRTVEVRLNDLRIMKDVSVEDAPHEIIGGKLVLHLDIPSFSPLIVKMMS